jgi:pyrroloquinoline quinone (PQQ) biosynthesis protein C
MSETHWIKDRAQQRAWFAWLKEANAYRGLSVSYAEVKANALRVEHMGEFGGTFAEAQKIVLDYLDNKVYQASTVDDEGVTEIEIPW